MRTLSERLYHEAGAGWGESLASLLLEAADLAKRYEEAPVRKVHTEMRNLGHGYSGEVQSVQIGCDLTPNWKIPELDGKRVRLVVEEG